MDFEVFINKETMVYIMKKSSLRLILLIGLIIMNVGIETQPQHQMVRCKNPMCDIMVKARGYQPQYLNSASII
jgi:hypothetical protein